MTKENDNDHPLWQAIYAKNLQSVKQVLEAEVHRINEPYGVSNK